jgi:hypothetical protein
MAKPLTQKQLKAMQKKAQAALENALKKELASVLSRPMHNFTETSKVDRSGAPGIVQARQ